MALINCPECNSEISSQAEACPKCGYSLRKHSKHKSSSGCGAGCLVVIVIFAFLWLIGSLSDYDSGSSRSSRTSSRLPAPQGPQLELLDWNWSHEYGYATVKGQVKNITSRPLENVEAVVTFMDANGGFITTGDALIDFNPILPGQTSPFSAMATWNPAMNKASVQFKSLFGGTISHRKKE